MKPEDYLNGYVVKLFRNPSSRCRVSFAHRLDEWNGSCFVGDRHHGTYIHRKCTFELDDFGSERVLFHRTKEELLKAYPDDDAVLGDDCWRCCDMSGWVPGQWCVGRYPRFAGVKRKIKRLGFSRGSIKDFPK